MTQNRWEYGAELTLPLHFEPLSSPDPSPWREQGHYFGSGRDALRAVLRHGRANRGWKRLLLPSYTGQDIVAAALEELAVAAYGDRPSLSRPEERDIDPRPGDVIYTTNYFGLRHSAWSLGFSGNEVIEDHSHDPWSPWAFASKADFAIVGLRHTLPLPDGGVVWSPQAHRLPPRAPSTPDRLRVSADKLAAALLKTLYLAGHSVDKDRFRRIAADAERQIAAGEISGITEVARVLFDVLPLQTWRERRQRNFATAATHVSNMTELGLLRPLDASCVPFAVALVFDSAAERSHARARMIAARVYPSALWPLDIATLEGVDAGARDLSDRLLTLACDYRYDAPDVERAMSVLMRALGESQPR